MAPEQKDRRRTDHRADIYSLGVVLYEMLTGEMPGKPIEPPSRKVQIDVRLDEVVLRTLEKEPERRYQTAAEVRTQVETIASTPSASPAAVAKSFPLFVEREGRRYLCWPGVFLVCGTIGLVVLAGNLAIALLLWLLDASVRLTFTAGELMFAVILMGACALMRLTAFKLAAHETAQAGRAPMSKPGPAMIFLWTVVLVILSAAMAAGVAFFVSWIPRVLTAALTDANWLSHIARITRVGVSIAMLVLGGLFFIHSIVRAAFGQKPLPPTVAPQTGCVPRFTRRGRMLLLRDLPVAIVVAVILRTFVIQNYRAATDAVSPEIPRGSWMLVYKLARTFQTGDIVAYRHAGKVFAGRVAEAGPRDGTLRVQRKEKSPASIPAVDIIGKVIFNTRAGGQDNRDVSQSLLRGAAMTQNMVKDIQPDGTIRFKTTITKRNTTSEPLTTLRFYNSDFVHVEKLTDAPGRTIPFTVTRGGNMTLRYQATLVEPVKPGAEHSYVTEGTETGLVKRLPESDVFEYSTRHWPGMIRTRRIELHRLPTGAQLLSKQPNDLVARTRDGVQEWFIDRSIPSGDSLEISYTYRLPTKP